MDPTQDQMDARRLMVSVAQALDKIVNDFKRKRQETGVAPESEP